MARTSTLETLIDEDGHDLNTILRLIEEDGVTILHGDWDAKEFSRKLIKAALNEVATVGKDDQKQQALASNVAHAISIVWTAKYKLQKG